VSNASDQVSNLFDRDHTDVLVLLMGIFAAVGLALAVFLTRRAWQAQVVALLALTGTWAGVLADKLASDSYGHDCNEPHHEGDLPMLIVTLAWAGVLLVGLLARNPPFARVMVRVALPLLTAALIGGTIAVLLRVQPAC
jgi:hypothetical protein